MARMREFLRFADLRLGRPAFVLSVACALMVAPVGALGLSWQRGTPAEQNEERTELPGSEPLRGSLNQVSRSAKGELAPGASTRKCRTQVRPVSAARRSIVAVCGSAPAADSWHSPLRC